MRAQNLQRSTLKKTLKVSKRNLESEFSLAKTPDELSTITPPSAVISANQNGDSEEGSLLDVATPDDLASSDSVALSSLTQFSSTTEKSDKSDGPTSHCGSKSQPVVQNVSVEAEILSEVLKQARDEVFKSADIGQRSKMVLHALIKMTIEDFYGLPKENNVTTKLMCAKLVLVFFAVVFALIFLAKFGSNNYRGPLPT